MCQKKLCFPGQDIQRHVDFFTRYPLAIKRACAKRYITAQIAVYFSSRPDQGQRVLMAVLRDVFNKLGGTISFCAVLKLHMTIDANTEHNV